MNSIFTELLTVTKKINNRLLSSATWDSTTEHKFTVPTGKRWFVLDGGLSRDVSSDCKINIYDSGDNLIDGLGLASTATGTYWWPNATYPLYNPKVVDAGEYIDYLFASAQSTAAWIMCRVLEVGV